MKKIKAFIKKHERPLALVALPLLLAVAFTLIATLRTLPTRSEQAIKSDEFMQSVIDGEQVINDELKELKPTTFARADSPYYGEGGRHNMTRSYMYVLQNDSRDQYFVAIAWSRWLPWQPMSHRIIEASGLDEADDWIIGSLKQEGLIDYIPSDRYKECEESLNTLPPDATDMERRLAEVDANTCKRINEDFESLN